MISNPFNRETNRFKAVSIPSTRKMFERYGYSLQGSSHPDNTDPTNFNEVSSFNTHSLHTLGNAISSQLNSVRDGSCVVDDLPADETPDSAPDGADEKGDTSQE